MSADQQYLILFTALSRLYSAFSQMRLRGRQSLSEIECRVNGVFFLMPWGCIDGTPHEIYRSQVEPQAQFYSGHRHYHVVNTQLIVDNQGNIVFLQAGFLGSINDAGNFILMDRIGPGTAYDMLACSKRSDSGERCEVKIAMKSRGGLGREVLSHLPPPPSLAFIFSRSFFLHTAPHYLNAWNRLTICQEGQFSLRTRAMGILSLF